MVQSRFKTSQAAYVILGLVVVTVFPNFGCTPKPVSSTVPEDAVLIRGAGATFPAALYNKWIEVYEPKSDDVLISYEAIGSGGGIKRFLAEEAAEAERVEFGASDAALTDEQIASVERGVRLVPMTAGSIVIAYNLDGIDAPLRLSRDVYVDIFLGKISQWNDPRIIADNPDLDMSKKKRNIVVAARRDSSGTTFAFTNHLSAISEEWRDRGPGPAKLVDWPGSAMMALGNEGVAGLIKRNPATIGYVEYGVAERAGLSMAVIENKHGEFVAPSGSSGMSTLTNAELPENLRAFFPDPDGEQSYPIVTYTWVMLYQKYEEARVASELKKFFEWCLTEGQEYNESLGMIRLPPQVVERSRSALAEIQ